MTLKDIKRVMTSRSMLGAILFALALWGYTRLNSSYQTRVELELEVIPPKDRAITETLPENIMLEVSGTGWHLFNFLYTNTSKKCVVDLSEQEIRGEEYTLSRNDFLKGLESMENVSPEYFNPNSITMKTGRIASKKVPIRSNIKIIPNEKYSKVGEPQFYPDSVTIRGPANIVRQIKSWSTANASFENIIRPYRGNVSLLDSLDDLVSLSLENVEFYADIQQAAERTFNDVPIIIRGSSLPRNHKIIPPFLTITVRSGIEVISQMTRDEIIITLNYNELIQDSTGLIRPTIKLPPDVEIIKLEPEYIHHYLVRSQQNLLSLDD